MGCPTKYESENAPCAYGAVWRDEDEGISVEDYRKDVLPSSRFLTISRFGANAVTAIAGAATSTVGRLAEVISNSSSTGRSSSTDSLPVDMDGHSNNGNGSNIGTLFSSLKSSFLSGPGKMKRRRSSDDDFENDRNCLEEMSTTDEDIQGGKKEKLRRIGDSYESSFREV